MATELLKMFGEVSIHTRHYWRVKPAMATCLAGYATVSIHTRHYWRVKPKLTKAPTKNGVFQSTPAITGG